MSNVRPRALIVALEAWPVIARLPRALQRSGFGVAALCHRHSFLAATRYLDQLFSLRSQCSGGAVRRSLAETINEWKPQVIIPGDDRTVLFFQRMVQLHQSGERTLPPKVSEALQLSFGNFDWLAEATSKLRTLQRAQALGLKTPGLARSDSVEEAVSQAKKLGWPVVLKKSTSWGGGGVVFCDNERQVAAAFAKFNESNLPHGRPGAGLVPKPGRAPDVERFPADATVTVNEAVRGKAAMIAVAAAAGKVLAHAAAIKEQCHPAPTGPPSVVRLVRHSGMLQTAKRLIGHWGATGLISFDFMLTAEGEASLIECNARPICLSHMGEWSGRDLCLALHHHFAGLEIPKPSKPRHEVVALFPREWRRDPRSRYLIEARHDVPWDDPGLVGKLIQDWRWRGAVAAK
ncbi:MAG: hypothetical protein KGR98_08455 [Verrucomicrobia bacterium]|nr:hypothetical protein [Verrucomicrobiota bacterium]MDE3100164.1 hypothetical protein [Verrucomicrobiota bacterium]